MRTFAEAGRVLGALEERVMEVLWKYDGPLSVREVGRNLGRKRLAHTTVMTTLDRLYKKGLLAREKHGTAYVYWAAMSRDDYRRRIVEETVSALIEESAEPVLSAFVDAAASIDEENLARLSRLIAKKRKTK